MAIPSYKRLYTLSRALKETQPAAEGAAPHLVDHVQREVSQVYTQIRDALSANLSATMDKLNWPATELKLDSSLISTWIEQAGDLLELQELDLGAPTQAPSQTSTDPVILLPLMVMAKPLQLRFRYHFYGDRPTNRLDKPEYFLSHIFDILEDQYGFMLDYVQPLLDGHTSQFSDVTYPDAMSAFISALLPMVQKKVLSLLKDISQQPQMLSHLVHELMTFDTTLRLAWGYVPIPHAIVDWKGLTWSVLVTHAYFDPWLNVEKDFALARYEAIISSPDGRDIDYESLESGSTKPTKSAIRVNDLLETITDRYRPLSSFSQKLRFLIEIQLEIFDQYHQRLHGSLERYIMDTSTLGKVIQSSGTHDSNTPNLQGRFGLESLVKVFGSADYLERKMADWGDDIFFLELWDELQDRARRNAGQADASVGRNLAVSEVASRTSNSIALDGTTADNGDDASGALFDETASAYRRLRLKAEEQIHGLLTTAIISSLRPYARSSGWTTLTSLDGPEAESNLTPSSALDAPLTLIHEYISFLSSVLASAPLRRVVKALCAAVQRFIWENVLTRHTFSASGAMQLEVDVKTIKGVLSAAAGRGAAGEAERGMGKLDAGIRLLGLPVGGGGGVGARKGEKDANMKDPGDENEDDDDSDSDSTPPPDQPSPDENHIWSLEEVEQRVFQSNEAARQVLADMGLWMVSEVEARKILERRVELGR